MLCKRGKGEGHDLNCWREGEGEGAKKGASGGAMEDEELDDAPADGAEPVGVGRAADVRKGHAAAAEFGPVGEESPEARAVVEERKAGALGGGHGRHRGNEQGALGREHEGDDGAGREDAAEEDDTGGEGIGDDSGGANGLRRLRGSGGKGG